MVCIIWSLNPINIWLIIQLTLGVADAAVADAAPPLHGLQVFVVPEVSLLHRRREVFDHRVKLTQHVAQILLVDELRCKENATKKEKHENNCLYTMSNIF